MQNYKRHLPLHRQIHNQVPRLGHAVVEHKVKPDSLIIIIIKYHLRVGFITMVPVRRIDFLDGLCILLPAFLFYADDVLATAREKRGAVKPHTEFKNGFYRHVLEYLFENANMAPVTIGRHIIISAKIPYLTPQTCYKISDRKYNYHQKKLPAANPR
jgi:hypothetical protein